MPPRNRIQNHDPVQLTTKTSYLNSCAQIHREGVEEGGREGGRERASQRASWTERQMDRIGRERKIGKRGRELGGTLGRRRGNERGWGDEGEGEGEGGEEEEERENERDGLSC